MIFYYYGDNEYAIAEQLRLLKAQYEKSYADGLEYLAFDAGELKFADLENALLSQPMFYSHRLVVISNLMNLRDATDKLTELLDKVPESTVAVGDGRGLDKRSALHKMLAGLPKAKKFPAQTEIQLLSWLKRTAKKSGATLNDAQARQILRRVGHDQWRLAGEIAKLVAAADGSEITHNMVEDLIIADPQDTVFDLIRAVDQGQTGIALKLYDQLVRSGSSDQQLIAMLQWQYRSLALAISGAGPDEAAAAGIKPYALSKARESVRNMTAEDVARSFEALLDADTAIKSGLKKSHQAMTDLVLTLSLRS